MRPSTISIAPQVQSCSTSCFCPLNDYTRLVMKHFANFIIVLLTYSAIRNPLCVADESRVSIEDGISRSHQEVISPGGDSHNEPADDEDTHEDDGPLVFPVSYHDGTPVQQDTTKSHHQKGRFKVASLKIQYVATPFLISLWLLIGGLTTIGFHVTPKLSLICPESCILIVVGIIIGLLLFYAGLTNVGPLTPNIFFLYMLPPIVLDAGYFMPNRQFFDNLATILMFAVVGTVLNATAVGVSLWAVGLTGLYSVDMPLLDTLLFSSIACAVDPIAVLAVFEEIHVNEVLYILVFGESLLNDAVTVVLYHMFEGYAEMGPDNIITVDYLSGFASFFVVAVGGTAVGIVWGVLAAFVSRFTHHVRVIEPLFVFIMSYLSYVSAELFHFSGILSLTFCGITMKNYVEENISYKSHVTVKYAMKMLASSSETIIFLFLGVSTVNDNHEWNTWFVVMTIIFCTLYRTLGVVVLTALANRFRLHRINKVEQFILAYGGLRGAVAFALALVVSDRVIPTKNMMVTTIIALVFFTVFVQGMTIGPLVRILNVRTSNKVKLSMSERIYTRSMDHLMAAIEDIVGQTMGNYHLRDKFKYYNNRYFRPILTRNQASAEPKIFETHSKLNLADAMNLVNKNSSLIPMMGKEISGMSLSSLFRTYTQANLEKTSQPGSKKTVDFATAGLPRNDSSFLNVDMGELEYSPSHKDLADAELHHILSDAMFKSSKRQHRHPGKSTSFDEQKEQPSFRHRLHMRHVMSSDQRYNRRRNTQGRSGNQSRSSSNSSRYQRTKSPTPSGSAQNDVVSGVRKKHAIVPVLKFTGPDDYSSPENEAPQSMPTQTRATLHETTSSYSSLAELRPSGQEDEGIVFVASGETSYAESQTKSGAGCSLVAPEQEILTLTETTLPWKRRDTSTDPIVRKKQECPHWVSNREHIVYASPSNTLLQWLNASSRRRSPSAVFEELDDPTSSYSNDPQDKDAAIAIKRFPSARDSTDESLSAKDETNSVITVQIETEKPSPETKDTIIYIKNENDDQSDEDSSRWQGTRL